MSKITQKIAQSVTSLANSATEDGLSFERAIAELETIVSQMESAELPLEQSLSTYKRGTALLQYCQKALSDIEQQVRILNESSQLQPYSATDE